MTPGVRVADHNNPITGFEAGGELEIPGPTPSGELQSPFGSLSARAKLNYTIIPSLARQQMITHIDLRLGQVEQDRDVLIWGPKPSIGILVPCSLAAKGGWVEHP